MGVWPKLILPVWERAHFPLNYTGKSENSYAIAGQNLVLPLAAVVAVAGLMGGLAAMRYESMGWTVWLSLNWMYSMSYLRLKSVSLTSWTATPVIISPVTPVSSPVVLPSTKPYQDGKNPQKTAAVWKIYPRKPEII